MGEINESVQCTKIFDAPRLDQANIHMPVIHLGINIISHHQDRKYFRKKEGTFVETLN